MGTFSQRTGLEESGLHFAESEVPPLRGWALRPDPDDLDDTFEPEELEAALEGEVVAADEFVHVEYPLREVVLGEDLYPEESDDYDWEFVEDLTP